MGLLEELVATLEPREISALECFGAGRSRDEIAAELGIGPRAVVQSLAEARRKLGARSHIHAAAMLRIHRRQGGANPVAGPCADVPR